MKTFTAMEMYLKFTASMKPSMPCTKVSWPSKTSTKSASILIKTANKCDRMSVKLVERQNLCVTSSNSCLQSKISAVRVCWLQFKSESRLRLHPLLSRP